MLLRSKKTHEYYGLVSLASYLDHDEIENCMARCGQGLIKQLSHGSCFYTEEMLFFIIFTYASKSLGLFVFTVTIYLRIEIKYHEVSYIE